MDGDQRSISVIWPQFKKKIRRTFLNSDAHFLIVVDIGGGSVVCAASAIDASPSPLSAQSGVVVTKMKLTISQRWHPGLNGVRETFDQSTQAKDPRMQQPQLLCIARVLA